jgi:hypothetical protein
VIKPGEIVNFLFGRIPTRSSIGIITFCIEISALRWVKKVENFLSSFSDFPVALISFD